MRQLDWNAERGSCLAGAGNTKTKATETPDDYDKANLEESIVCSSKTAWP